MSRLILLTRKEFKKTSKKAISSMLAQGFQIQVVR